MIKIPIVRLQIAESELSLTESKINELSTLLNRAKDEKATTDRQHQSELKRTREVRTYSPLSLYINELYLLVYTLLKDLVTATNIC